MKKRMGFGLLLFAVFAVFAARAEVRLPALISDHMVLQAERPARVWGWADPGENVAVRFASRTGRATADATGHWAVWLHDLNPGAAGTLVVEGKNRIEVQDVVAGEVWLASGQSNMERALYFSNDAARVIAAASNPRLRLFHADHAVAAHPAEDLRGRWELADPKTVRNFSAAAYFFGKRLQAARGVPVGLIESNFGGTPIESWMSEPSVAANPALAFVKTEWAAFLATYPGLMARYDEQVAAWRAKASEKDRTAFDAGKPVEGAPAKPRGPGSQNDPYGLYNGMIAPIAPYSLRGILWNQGENNARSPHEAYWYRALLQTLIEDWRQAWGEDELPFVVVQLSRYKDGGLYPLLRESQAQALHLAHTALVVTADVGMAGDVHYPDKATVGDRLFRAVQRLAYGESVVASGPRLVQTLADDGALRLRFAAADGGLVLKPSTVPVFGTLTPETGPEDTADGKSVLMLPPSADDIAHAFLIAGEDGGFQPASVKVNGDSLVLTSPRVAQPVQVCYGWQDTVPAMVLWNGAGWPASPFRAASDPRKTVACPGARVSRTDRVGGSLRKS